MFYVGDSARCFLNKVVVVVISDPQGRVEEGSKRFISMRNQNGQSRIAGIAKACLWR